MIVTHEYPEDLATQLSASVEVMIFSIKGPFFFAAIDGLEQSLHHSVTEPKALVVSLYGVVSEASMTQMILIIKGS